MKPATALGLLLLLFLPLKGADAAVESPLAIKQRVLHTLRAISTADEKLQGQLRRAAELLERSLSDRGRSLFLDGWRLAPPPTGEKMFEGERDAIDILLHALERKGVPPPIVAAVAQAVGDLVAADRSIATLSVETARRLRAVEPAAADAQRVAAASLELLRALGERNPARAVDRLASAWRLSQSAVDDEGLSISDFADAPDPFSPSTAHIVSATFVSLQAEHGDRWEHGERRGGVLELVEIVQDASGVVVRRLRSERAISALGDRARVTLSSAWDGRDGGGKKVTDGNYSYLAFGRLKPRRGRREADEVSFPVMGTVLFDGTAPLITAQLNPPPNANGWNHETVTVTYAATDLLSGVVSVTPPAVVAGEGEAQLVEGMAADAAGNVAKLSVFVNLDRTPPSIQPAVTPAANAAGWHHGPVSVTFAVGDALSGVASTPAPVAVVTDGTHEVTGHVTDRAGNAAAATVAIKLDQVPPVVAITSPADSVSVPEPDLVLTGTVTDATSGIQSVACNGSPATLIGTSFSCAVTLHEGANDIVVSAGDVAANVGSSAVHVTFAPAPDEDEDTDGVPSSVEDLAPHSGDGNGDDVPDSDQAHVVSLPNGVDGRYVTLEFLPGTAPTMVKAVANPSPANAPSPAGFPLGFFDFRVAGLTPGGTLAMTMYLPAGVGLSTYYRFGPTPDNAAPHWYDFAFDGTTGAEMRAGRILLHFVDGGRGDDDLTANGQIADPGGPSNGPCPLLHDPKVSLAPAQSYNCQLPPFGTGSFTWTLTNTADGTPSVLPPGLALVEDSGQFSIQGTVADDAYLIASRVALRVTGVLGSPIEEVTEVPFNVEIPIKVWTQNTILRPDHLLEQLDDIPHNSVAALIAFFIFGVPSFPAGMAIDAVIALDEHYHHKVKNTASDNRQRANTIISRAAPFDIVALQEVFNDEDLNLIKQEAHGHFVLTGPARKDFSVFPPAFPEGSGGLAVLVKKGLAPASRESADRLVHLNAKFEDCNPNTDDCLANKGFTFDIVHLGPNPNHYIYVIDSHTQSNGDQDAPPDPANPEARRAQFEQINEFIDRFADRRHPVLIMGDLNVEADDRIEHRTMLRTLGVGDHDDLFGELHPDLVTYDITRNAYAKNWFDDSPLARLDYMLVRQGTRYRLDADYLTLADERVDTSMCDALHWIPNSEAPNLQCYLSDHFGIKGQLKLGEDLPYVHILSPADGAIVLQGEKVSLSAFAGNPLHHRSDLFDETNWASNVEGALGSRALMTWRPFAVGPQTISASIVDFDGFAASSSITVYVRADTDRDGIGDDDEVIRGTDPLNPDTDGDSLEDGAEVHTHGTDPLNRDTDGDGLDDGSEVRGGSSPLVADTDRDGLADGFEVANHTNPASRDSDSDGVWDGPEVILPGGDPISAARKPTDVPDGTLLTQTLGFLAIVDPVRGLVGHVGTPAGGLGFGLAFDGQRRLLVSAITGLVIADPLTGLAIPVAPFHTTGGEQVHVINLAFDAAGGNVYGVEEGPAPDFLPTGQLLQIDPATAVVMRVGLAAEPIHALAFDPSGRLLVALAGADGLDRLVEMDRATGAALQEIGAIGFQPVFGLAVDWSGALFGSAVRPSGYQGDLLKVDTATGAGTSIAGFSQALFDLAFYVSAAPRFGPIEDFASDANPSQPGFASSVFVHSAGPGGIVNQSGFSTPTPYPSPPFAYFLVRNTSDTVTFNLNAGESIDRARVRANRRFGDGSVRFVGTGDTKTMTTIGQNGWIVLEVASIGLGDLGLPLGDILRIELSGGEALVDDLEVHIHR